ncbi:ATP-binding protein, partial [Xanthovirga aplysinae]|uniref:ATP-binding protein n=1 Tax=Xanthovirga aplysinae TaxID=2529853 RepID=UPI0012BB5593
GSPHDALRLLADGKYDLALVNEFVAQTIQFRPEYSNLRLTGPPMNPAPLAFAAHKGDTVLINKINEGIEILKAQRRYIDIYNKWFSIYIPQEASRSYHIMKYVRWVVGGILLLLLLAVIGIFTLRRMVKLQTRAIKKELTEKQIALNEFHKTNKELDNFVYSISHDINAPIASVLGLVNIMKYDVKGPEAEGYIEKIEHSIENLRRYINDVLNFSRNSRVDLVFEKITFSTLINETFSMLKFLPYVEKISFKYKIKEEAPFFSDKFRLKTVLNNLLSNAIKYADFSKPNPYILVKITTGEDSCHLSIEDNGIGIPKDYQEHIYNMFYRATELASGSGIGLYIVKEILQKIGGKIELVSEEGKGSTFNLSIPNQKKANVLSVRKMKGLSET